MRTKNRPIEVLAPAGSMECLKAAILNGADAVYLGGEMFGARAYAGNFNKEELLEAIDYVHLYGKKLFLTVNTLMKEEELPLLPGFLKPFYEQGLDAVIVQDMGVFTYIREHFPERPVFVVKGDVAFKKRQSIVTEFDSTINGILICTQQSLSSSVNIPTCNDVILESLQWNIPRMEQFYFRFIRLDSKEMKDVHYVTYEDSVEQNLMALVLTKERLNEFIKTGEVKEQSEIFEEFDITMSVIDSLLIRTQDSEGKIHISWGSQRITE